MPKLHYAYVSAETTDDAITEFYRIYGFTPAAVSEVVNLVGDTRYYKCYPDLEDMERSLFCKETLTFKQREWASPVYPASVTFGRMFRFYDITQRKYYFITDINSDGPEVLNNAANALWEKFGGDINLEFHGYGFPQSKEEYSRTILVVAKVGD